MPSAVRLPPKAALLEVLVIMCETQTPPPMPFLLLLMMLHQRADRAHQIHPKFQIVTLHWQARPLLRPLPVLLRGPSPPSTKLQCYLGNV